MNIKYTIKFLDYWHLSSGLSGGAQFDSMVVKDENKIPYVPGKTIKGLVREMAEELFEQNFIEKYFGTEGNKQGEIYFTNAVIEDKTYKSIVENKLQDKLFDVIASTQIGENGIAKDNSLREIEVVIPLELSGEILDIDDEEAVKNIMKALKMVKRMGLNRSRGLGRCEISGEISK